MSLINEALRKARQDVADQSDKRSPQEPRRRATGLDGLPPSLPMHLAMPQRRGPSATVILLSVLLVMALGVVAWLVLNRPQSAPEQRRLAEAEAAGEARGAEEEATQPLPAAGSVETTEAGITSRGPASNDEAAVPQPPASTAPDTAAEPPPREAAGRLPNEQDSVEVPRASPAQVSGTSTGTATPGTATLGNRAAGSSTSASREPAEVPDTSAESSTGQGGTTETERDPTVVSQTRTASVVEVAPPAQAPSGERSAEPAGPRVEGPASREGDSTSRTVSAQGSEPEVFHREALPADGARLHLGFIVYSKSRPFAEINGQFVNQGEEAVPGYWLREVRRESVLIEGPEGRWLEIRLR